MGTRRSAAGVVRQYHQAAHRALLEGVWVKAMVDAMVEDLAERSATGIVLEEVGDALAMEFGYAGRRRGVFD
jgi:hypothetical protein